MRGWVGVRASVGTAAAVALGSAGLLGAVVATATPAAAGSFTVSNNDPSGLGSLQQAFMDASGSATPNTITVNPGVGQINLAAELLYSSNASLSLEGNGVTINQATPGDRVIHDTGTGLFSIDRVTITGGTLVSADGAGGAIDEDKTGSSLTLTNSTVSNNSSTATTNATPGADIIRTGNDNGAFTATNDTITGNTDTGMGGSTYGTIDTGDTTVTGLTVTNNLDQASGGHNAGGILDLTDGTITGTTVTGNRNIATGGGDAEGTLDTSNTTIGGSTVTGNTVQANAGGDANGILDSTTTIVVTSMVGSNTNSTSGGGDAEGIFDSSATTLTDSSVVQNVNSTDTGTAFGAIDASSVTAVNSTISDNTNPGASSQGGGIDDGPGGHVGVRAASGKHPGRSSAQAGTGTSLVYATVVGNTAQTGSNVDSSSAFHAFGSVVALGSGGANCTFGSTATSSGWNFSNDTSCLFTNTMNGDRQSGDPGLGAVANNGGPAFTQLPQPGSVLLDAIPAASCQADGAAGITTDERGLPRPDSLSPNCDIGAAEVQPAPPTVTAAFTG